MVRDFAVRKHRSPKGALRQLHRVRVGQRVDEVRKHRAPKGALRPAGYRRHGALDSHCQKAPSAIRCIKTRRAGGLNGEVVHAVRKHRAPKGALRLHEVNEPSLILWCLKTLSAKRCIKTRQHLSLIAPLVQSESTEHQKVH